MTTDGPVSNEPVRPVLFQAQGLGSLIQPVSQISLTIRKGVGNSPFDDALGTVLDWMSVRVGRPLPQEARLGRSFTIDDIGAQRTEAVAIETPRYWAARLDDFDKKVPQRVWAIEIALEPQSDGSVRFGSRLQCISRGDLVPFESSIPNFVRDVIKHCGAQLDGVGALTKPYLINTEDEVNWLVSLLQSPERRHDIVVLALPEGSSDWSETLIPAQSLAWKLAGAAHVAVISSAASFRLSDHVGKAHSVFRQAIRTYRPGFDPNVNEPFAHPLGLPHRITEWQGGPSRYESFLVDQIITRTATRRDVATQLRPFLETKRLASESRRSAAKTERTSTADLLSLADEEIRELKEEIKQVKEEQNSFIALAAEECEAAIREAEQERQANVSLRLRISTLEKRFKESAIPPELPPDTLDDFENWCRANLSGSVEVHNRAFQGAKKSRFEDTPLIYKALLLLRDHYVPMRCEGGTSLMSAYQSRCHDLGLEEQASFPGGRWGEQGDTYFVTHGQTKILLDRHLKKGNSRDERYCFRLYFNWSSEHQRVLVGWLPSHLDTRAS